MPAPIGLEQIPGLVREGMRIFVQGSIGMPRALFATLGRANAGGLEVVMALLPGVNAPDLAPTMPPSRLITMFDYPLLRRAWQAGPIDVLPCHYGAFADHLRAVGPIDLALIQVAPQGDDGRFNLGVSADFVLDVLPLCRHVIAQANASMPAIPGAPSIPASAIDHIIEFDEPLSSTMEPRHDRRGQCIAQYAASLIDDGDTIQFGVGNLPQAVIAQLGDRKDLGLHTGLATEAVRHLIDGGSMTGARKSRDSCLHVAGVLSGGAEFYAWAAERDDFALRPVSYTHSLATLRELDNFIAINSALEVDLFGQANAEMAGIRQISGSGGLLDFVRGARSSRGGRAMICLPATSADGQRSNVVARLGGVATVPRTDIDMVVTEYGVARLRDLCAERRAEALIGIAAPAFRRQLEEAWNGCQQAWQTRHPMAN